MTSSYLNGMRDAIGVNVFSRELMKFLPIENVTSVPAPLLNFVSTSSQSPSLFLVISCLIDVFFWDTRDGSQIWSSLLVMKKLAWDGNLTQVETNE